MTKLPRRLARIDPRDLDGLIAPTLEALGLGLGADRLDVYLSSRLEASVSDEAQSVFPARGSWTRPGLRTAANARPSASLDLDALADGGAGLRCGRMQRIAASRSLASDGPPLRAVVSNRWQPLRSRIALPCVCGSELLGVLIAESEWLASRGSERLLARAEAAVECFAMSLDRHRLARELGEIRAAADRAGALIEEVLSFGRSRESDTELVDLSGGLRRLEVMIARVLGHGIELELKLESDASSSATPAKGEQALVRIDRAKLERVLLNLASNARAALDGGPAPARFQISTRRVFIDRNGREAGEPACDSIPGLREGEHLRLTARDNGCGMQPALTGRIFEPFFTTREKVGGTGLGLATIAEVVRKSQGGIRVESAPGEGTAFHLYFPLATSASADSPAATPRLDSRPARV